MLAVFAGEALLLAFALKLRVSAAVSGALGPRHRVPSGALGLGVDASYIGKAAGFLGQCMPLYALQPGTGKAVLQVRLSGVAGSVRCSWQCGWQQKNLLQRWGRMMLHSGMGKKEGG